MIADRSIPVASRLVSVIIAGFTGGVLIGCAYPVMATLAEVLDSALSRPVEVSPTITPTSDQGMLIALLLIVLWISVLVPVFLAVTGALSVWLSRGHIPDSKSCILISYASGIVSIASGIVIYHYLNYGLFSGLSGGDWFPGPGTIVLMLLSPLISAAGGAFFWLATKHATAKKPTWGP